MKRIRTFLQKRKARKAGANQAQSTQQAQGAQQPLRQPAQTPAVQQKAVQQAQAPVANVSATTSGTLTVALQNQTSSSNVYAYISGLAIDNGSQWVVMRSDAVTPYYLSSNGQIMQPLGADCAIRLGGQGSTIQARIPRIAGGRIWFSIDQPITFYVNPGPALVEPSVTNASDPNAQVNWSFAEFTFNADQLYANISYVDFVGIPIALTLNTVASGTQHVSGMNAGGLQQVATGLQQQQSADGKGWNQLIVNHAGTGNVLRILSPNQAMVTNGGLFSGYYDSCK